MPDAAIPIFQTVNQNGEATLEVEAVIKALGLSLPEATNFEGLGTTNEIFWKDATNIVRESIGAYSEPSTRHHMLLTAKGLLSKAQLGINGIDSGSQQSTAVVAGANGFTTTLIDGNGSSSFLQIAGEANQWTCNFGTTTFVWPGGAQVVSVPISHGLGVTPVMNICITSSIVCITAIPAHNATTFTVEVNDLAGIPTAGTATGISWLAIG